MAINSRPIPSRGNAILMTAAPFVILKRTTNGPRDEGPRESSSMPSPTVMDRRDFLKLAGAAAAAGPRAGQQAQMPTPMPGPRTPAASGAKEISGTVFNLEIAPVTVELAPNRIVSTIGYNGMSPGPDRKSTRLNSSHLGISYAVF